jgi:preprotein translocase subunit YajC
MSDLQPGDRVRLPMGEVATIQSIGRRFVTVVLDDGREARFPESILDRVRE